MSDERKRLEAKRSLRDKKSDEAYQEWLRQLRDRAYVAAAVNWLRSLTFASPVRPSP